MANNHDNEIFQVFYSAIRKAMENTELKKQYENWRTENNGRKEKCISGT